MKKFTIGLVVVILLVVGLIQIASDRAKLRTELAAVATERNILRGQVERALNVVNLQIDALVRAESTTWTVDRLDYFDEVHPDLVRLKLSARGRDGYYFFLPKSMFTGLKLKPGVKIQFRPKEVTDCLFAEYIHDGQPQKLTVADIQTVHVQ